MSRLALQVYTDSTMSTMIADWTHSAVGTVFETHEHGFGALTTFIPMSRRKAEYFYTSTPLAHIVLSNGVDVAYEGRIEDRTIVNGGLEITGFGYWNAMFDAPYSALWSATNYNDWYIGTEEDAANIRPAKYIQNQQDRLYIALRLKEIYTTTDYVEWRYRVPHLGERPLVEVDFTYDVTLPTNWLFETISREDDDTPVATKNTITGDGAQQTATQTIAITDEMLVFKVRNNTGDDYATGNEQVGVEKGSRPDLATGYQAVTVNNKFATSYIARKTFTATKMKVYLDGMSGAETCKLGIYSDNAGSPNALLATTYEIGAENRTGWHWANLETPVALATGATYWLAIIANGTFSVEKYTTGHSSEFNVDTYVGGFADPFGGSTSATYGLLIVAIADEWYASITDIAIRTTASNTVYADEIAKDLVSFISTLNSSQLSSSTALIQAPNLALADIKYDDAWPGRILIDLAVMGDDSSPAGLYETGVWENQVLFFRPLGDAAQTWYVDAASLSINSTTDTMYNSAYGLYKSRAGHVRRTAATDDDVSIAKYGITRRAAVNRNTQSDNGYTSSVMATAYNAAFLEDNKDITPRADVTVKEIFTASGARVKKWKVRAGHVFVLRSFTPAGSSELDKVSSFRLSRTRYHVDTDVLEPTPEEPTATLDVLVAQHAAKLR